MLYSGLWSGRKTVQIPIVGIWKVFWCATRKLHRFEELSIYCVVVNSCDLYVLDKDQTFFLVLLEVRNQNARYR